MNKTPLLHPHMLAALARAGHTSKVLLSDANFPHSTKSSPRAELVYLNLCPGQVPITDVLRVLAATIPIELAEVMDYARTGPYAMQSDPPVWKDFRDILAGTDCNGQLQKVERFAFYEAASSPDVCLTVATGEQRFYSNILLTIGAIRPG